MIASSDIRPRPRGLLVGREKRGRLYNIPVKDGREFIVAQKLWEDPAHTYYLCLLLGVVFFLSFLFLEYITGELWKPTVDSLFAAIFLVIGLLCWINSFILYRHSDVALMEKRFIRDFTGRRGKSAKMMVSYWIDTEYNDTDHDYLILKIDMFWYGAEVYVRGDVVHQIVGFILPDKVNDVNPEEILGRIDMMLPAAIQPRKNALLFAKHMLMNHRDEFVEAFVRQPVYSLRYIEKISMGEIPPPDDGYPVESS